MKKLILGATLIGALALAACAAEAPQPEAEAMPEAPAAEPALMFEPSVSINRVMVDLVNDHATLLWDSDMNQPETDEDWQELRHAATAVSAAGSITAMGGTGDGDMEMAAQDDWVRLSQAMTNVGTQMLTAVMERNYDQLQLLGNDLVNTCVNCHNVYRLEVPDIWSERAQRVPEAQ